jgi:hypothetical protein
LEVTHNDFNDDQARELRDGEGKTHHKQNNINDMMICLPEFGFQMKPIVPGLSAPHLVSSGAPWLAR